MFIKEGIVDVDCRDLRDHDDIEGHRNVHILQNVTYVLNVSIEAELKDLEADSDEDHDGAEEVGIFGSI
jgi:hypothetical protein